MSESRSKINRRSFIGWGSTLVSAAGVAGPVWAREKQAAVDGSALAGEIPAVRGLAERLFSGRAREMDFELLEKEDGLDVFELETSDGRLLVRGSNALALSSGLHWYLKHHCRLHFSWRGDRLELPARLPEVPFHERRRACHLHNVYLNYCTYGYTMPWWDWPRWERELDFMALNGVSLPLFITGVEAVWMNTLRRLGYSDKEAKEFISGPAYFPWWLMGNLEGWGGPLPDSWIDSHLELGQKIVARMREFGMSPMMHGFVGLVPRTLAGKKPGAHIIEQGRWCGDFERPSILDPTDPLFPEIASIWYEELFRLFGPCRYFAGDLFHEGGKTGGVDVAKGAQCVYAEMTKAKSDAVWVLQGWGGNPKPALLGGLRPGQALILDLAADEDPQYVRRGSWRGHPWVYNTIVNFGGNPGVMGRLPTEARDLDRLHSLPWLAGNLTGIGTTPEAIGMNPVTWDFHFEMFWRTEKPDLPAWVRDYARRRYGSDNPDALEAWTILLDSAYNQGRSRGHQSIICWRVRPSLIFRGATTWGSGRMQYQPHDLARACELMHRSSSELALTDTFVHDLVDVTRQFLSNLARPVFRKMSDAFFSRKPAEYAGWSQLMLELILDLDELLATRPEFLVGTWIEEARSWGKTREERDLYEWNARLLVTTWTFRDGSLHDYSHREWSGLLRDYYLPRWSAFIDYHGGRLEGREVSAPDYYEKIEKPWTESRKPYPALPVGDPVGVASRMFEKYKKLMLEEKL